MSSATTLFCGVTTVSWRSTGRQSRHLRSLLLGRNPESIPRGKSIDELIVTDIPAGLPSVLLERRPDIIQAEQSLIAANARIGVARALYFPRISLTGALGTASINSGDLFDGDSQTWQVGGDLLGPIFTFGAIEGQVMASEAAQREALFQYRQAIISAFREVEDALVATTKGRERQTAQGRRTRALENYQRLATAQFDAGTTGYLQVLDANRSLFTSLIDVYRAMGGGWVDEADLMSESAAPYEDAVAGESADIN